MPTHHESIADNVSQRVLGRGALRFVTAEPCAPQILHPVRRGRSAGTDTGLMLRRRSWLVVTICSLLCDVVELVRPRGRHASDPSLERNRASHRRVGHPTVPHGHHPGDILPVRPPRSRQHVYGDGGPSDRVDGTTGAQDSRADTAGQRLLRATDRHHASRVSRLADPRARGTPPTGPSRMGGALQPRSSIRQPGSGHSTTVARREPARVRRSSPSRTHGGDRNAESGRGAPRISPDAPRRVTRRHALAVNLCGAQVFPGRVRNKLSLEPPPACSPDLRNNRK